MSIRFAGSRCVDERRRRRLAQEADAPSDAVVRAPSASSDDAESRLPRGSSPVDTLISPRLWKHAAVAIATFLAWGVVLAIGLRADRAADGLESIVGLAAGKLTTFFSTVMLLAAGQLAFINLWYRSRSRKDFSGSYKLWFYAAVGWLTLCAFQATGAHWNLADALLAGRPVAIWNARLLVWLIPAAIIVTPLYQLLLRELRDCSLSLWTLRLSGVAAATAGATWVFGPFVLAPHAELFASASAATLWHLLLALAMLFHARHVIHVSNEPPQRPIVRWRLRLPALSWLRGLRRRPAADQSALADPKPKRTAKPKRSAAVRETEPAPAEADAESETHADRAALDLQASAAAKVVATPAPQTAPVATTAAAPIRPAPAAAKSPPVTTAQSPIRRVDPPQAVAAAKTPALAAATKRDSAPVRSSAPDGPDADEEDDRSTLSKKERRRMKKLARSGEF